MTAEIIAVGTELLLGDIVNTNAQFLAKELAALGIFVYYQTVVGDNAERLEQTVRQAMQRSDLLIFTGGLGPTEDDLTKQTVARAYGDELRFDAQELEKIRQFFERWGRTMTPNNEKQAYVPVYGRKLENENGTAPGMIFENTQQPGRYAVLLPGPPREMKPMFLSQVRPWLKKMSGTVLHSVTLRATGIGESHVEPKVAHLLAQKNPTAALYAKPGEVVIRITASAPSDEQARELCYERAQDFYKLLGDVIYTDTLDSLEQAVVQALAQRGLRAATAESCTGGLLSARITAVPGASRVFECGVCTYSNSEKRRLLQISDETLARFGAVSPQTAAQMAVGIRESAGADFGVAITGIAGPDGGTDEKPVGLVYIAACERGMIYIQKLLMTGRSREDVRIWASQHALEMLRRMALELPQPGCQQFSDVNEIDFRQEKGLRDV